MYKDINKNKSIITKSQSDLNGQQQVIISVHYESPFLCNQKNYYEAYRYLWK